MEVELKETGQTFCGRKVYYVDGPFYATAKIGPRPPVSDIEYADIDAIIAARATGAVVKQLTAVVRTAPADDTLIPYDPDSDSDSEPEPERVLSPPRTQSVFDNPNSVAPTTSSTAAAATASGVNAQVEGGSDFNSPQ